MDRASVRNERERAARQLQTVLGLLALGALIVANVVHARASTIGLDPEAATAMTSAFLILAAIDAGLLLVWTPLTRLVSPAR